MKLLLIAVCFVCACASKPKDDLDQFNQIKSDVTKSFHSTSNFGFPALTCFSSIGADSQNEFKIFVHNDAAKIELTGPAYRSINLENQKTIIERLSSSLKPMALYVSSLPGSLNTPQYKQMLSEKNGKPVLVGERLLGVDDMVRLEIDPVSHTINQSYKVKGSSAHTQYKYAEYNGAFLLSEMLAEVGSVKVRVRLEYTDAAPVAIIRAIKITSKTDSYDEKIFTLKDCKLLKREQIPKDFH